MVLQEKNMGCNESGIYKIASTESSSQRALP